LQHVEDNIIKLKHECISLSFVGSYYIANIMMLVHNNMVKGKVLPVHNMNASRRAEVAPVILNLVPDEAE
jgi:hypothetical protein